MNKARRNELRQLIYKLWNVKTKKEFYSLINDLDNIKYEESSYYDRIPENLQYSRRAEESGEAIEYLEEAIDLLEEVYDEKGFNKNNPLIEEAIKAIQRAI